MSNSQVLNCRRCRVCLPRNKQNKQLKLLKQNSKHSRHGGNNSYFFSTSSFLFVFFLMVTPLTINHLSSYYDVFLHTYNNVILKYSKCNSSIKIIIKIQHRRNFVWYFSFNFLAPPRSRKAFAFDFSLVNVFFTFFLIECFPWNCDALFLILIHH